MANFAHDALAERNRRLFVLAPAPAPILGRKRIYRDGGKACERKVEPLPCCSQCSQHFRKEQVCDGCDESFRWCYTGYTSYTRKSIEDPLYPNTEAGTLCGDCLRKSLSPSRLMEQDQEYLHVIDIFSSTSCQWKWVSCLCDCPSLISMTWVALEGLLLLLLPFYCQIGTEHGNVESSGDPKLHEFVLGCANEALLMLRSEPQDSVYVQSWQAVRVNPGCASNFFCGRHFRPRLEIDCELPQLERPSCSSSSLHLGVQEPCF